MVYAISIAVLIVRLLIASGKNWWKRIVELNDERTIQKYGGATDTTIE